MMGLAVFLKKAKEASASGPTDPIVRTPDEGAESYDSLHSAAGDLKQALDEGNTAAIAEALRAAFQICDSEYQEEDESQPGES